MADLVLSLAVELVSAHVAHNRVPAEDLPKLIVREGAGGLGGLRRTYSKPL